MSDAGWQHLPKARRAAVYRAIGRAGRIAREDGEPEIAADLRIAMEVLRTHAASTTRKKTKPTPKRQLTARRTRSTRRASRAR